MGFELQKKNRSTTGDDNQITITQNVLIIGELVSNFFKGYEYAELYFDAEDSLVGIRPTKSGITGFKLRNVNGRNYLVGTWLKRLALGVYDCEIVDDKVIFNCEVKY